MVLKSLFLFSCLLGCLDCTELPVKQGENATLECFGTKDPIVELLRWNKTDLLSDYVFYFSDDQVQEGKQHPSFKGRVNLTDPEMKNGDFSLILKNVTKKDAGIYECYVGYKKQKPQLINSTNLKVEEPGQTGGLSEGSGNKDGSGGMKDAPPGQTGGTTTDGGKDKTWLIAVVAIVVIVVVRIGMGCFLILR